MEACFTIFFDTLLNSDIFSFDLIMFLVKSDVSKYFSIMVVLKRFGLPD